MNPVFIKLWKIIQDTKVSSVVKYTLYSIAVLFVLFSVISISYQWGSKNSNESNATNIAQLQSNIDAINQSHSREIRELEHENRTLLERLKHPIETITVYKDRIVYVTETLTPDTLYVENPPPTVSLAGIEAGKVYSKIYILVGNTIQEYTVLTSRFTNQIIIPSIGNDSTQVGLSIEQKRFVFIFDPRIGMWFDVDAKYHVSPIISVGLLAWTTRDVSLGIAMTNKSIGPDIFFQPFRTLNVGIGASYGIFPERRLNIHLSTPIIRR